MRTTFLIAIVAYVAIVAWGISAVEAARPADADARPAISDAG